MRSSEVVFRRKDAKVQRFAKKRVICTANVELLSFWREFLFSGEFIELFGVMRQDFFNRGFRGWTRIRKTAFDCNSFLFYPRPSASSAVLPVLVASNGRAKEMFWSLEFGALNLFRI